MARQGPETRLVNRARKKAIEKYGERLVLVKQHGNEFTQGGVSDLLGCLDGTFVAIEMKAPESYGGSVERAVQEGPSVRQRAFIERVNAAGGVAGVAASVGQVMVILALAEAEDGNEPHANH